MTCPGEWLKFGSLCGSCVIDTHFPRSTCTAPSKHTNGIYSCQVTHPTRRDRGLAPRSSALQLFQRLLNPSLLSPGIHILRVPVRLHLPYTCYCIIPYAPMEHTLIPSLVPSFDKPGDLFFADTFFQGSPLMIVIFLETICVELLSLLRPPTDNPDRIYILGPRTTPSGMMLR